MFTPTHHLLLPSAHQCMHKEALLRKQTCHAVSGIGEYRTGLHTKSGDRLGPRAPETVGRTTSPPKCPRDTDTLLASGCAGSLASRCVPWCQLLHALNLFPPLTTKHNTLQEFAVSA
eukprot:scaffold3912_cov20-Tisochrysis_lutea.AAC.3